MVEIEVSKVELEGEMGISIEDLKGMPTWSKTEAIMYCSFRYQLVFTSVYVNFVKHHMRISAYASPIGRG